MLLLRFALVLTFGIVQSYKFLSHRHIHSFRLKFQRLNHWNRFNRLNKWGSNTDLGLFERIGVSYPPSLNREDLVNILLAKICITFLRSTYSATRNQTIEGLWIEEFTNKIPYSSISSGNIPPSLTVRVSANDDSKNSTDIILSKTAINIVLQALLAKRRESIILFKESPNFVNTFDKYKLTIFPGSYVNSVVAYILKSFEGKYAAIK